MENYLNSIGVSWQIVHEKINIVPILVAHKAIGYSVAGIVTALYVIEVSFNVLVKIFLK